MMISEGRPPPPPEKNLPCPSMVLRLLILMMVMTVASNLFTILFFSPMPPTGDQLQEIPEER